MEKAEGSGETEGCSRGCPCRGGKAGRLSRWERDGARGLRRGKCAAYTGWDLPVFVTLAGVGSAGRGAREFQLDR
jgi:hypothetical protein